MIENAEALLGQMRDLADDFIAQPYSEEDDLLNFDLPLSEMLEEIKALRTKIDRLLAP